MSVEKVCFYWSDLICPYSGCNSLNSVYVQFLLIFFLFLSELWKIVSKPRSSREWKCFFLSGSSILFLINRNIHLIKLNHFPKHHHEWLKCLSSISKDKTTGKECADELKGIDDIAQFQQILRRSSQVYWLIDYSLIVSPPRHGPFDLRYSQSAFSSWLHGWKNVQSLQTRLFSSWPCFELLFCASELSTSTDQVCF